MCLFLQGERILKKELQRVVEVKKGPGINFVLVACIGALLTWLSSKVMSVEVRLMGFRSKQERKKQINQTKTTTTKLQKQHLWLRASMAQLVVLSRH